MSKSIGYLKRIGEDLISRWLNFENFPLIGFVYWHAGIYTPLFIVYGNANDREELESFRVRCIFHSNYVIRRVMTSRITYILQEVCNVKELVSLQKSPFNNKKTHTNKQTTKKDLLQSKSISIHISFYLFELNLIFLEKLTFSTFTKKYLFFLDEENFFEALLRKQ